MQITFVYLTGNLIKHCQQEIPRNVINRRFSLIMNDNKSKSMLTLQLVYVSIQFISCIVSWLRLLKSSWKCNLFVALDWSWERGNEIEQIRAARLTSVIERSASWRIERWIDRLDWIMLILSRYVTTFVGRSRWRTLMHAYLFARGLINQLTLLKAYHLLLIIVEVFLKVLSYGLSLFKIVISAIYKEQK